MRIDDIHNVLDYSHDNAIMAIVYNHKTKRSFLLSDFYRILHDQIDGVKHGNIFLRNKARIIILNEHYIDKLRGLHICSFWTNSYNRNIIELLWGICREVHEI